MSLDQNLFTLNLTPHADNPDIVELIDPKETVHYRKERGDRQGASDHYGFGLFDPLTDSLLATVTAPSATSKQKTIELYNPTVPIELKITGTFTYRWTFKWEEHELEWKKEECLLIRKPDPPVLVAVTKEVGKGNFKKRAVQILDYNLNRFDINDRKGLEIVILSALLSFNDHNDDARRKRQDENSSSSQANPTLQVNATSDTDDASTPIDQAQRNLLPVEPPTPQSPSSPLKSGVEVIAEMQRGDLSEVLISEDGSVGDYAKYCANLLEADNMLFIVLQSSSPMVVPKVLQVAHETKVLHHRAGSDDELYQYVQYDKDKSKDRKTRRIIKLDYDAEEVNKYRPPESLTVHLSKIVMPELQPKAKAKERVKEKGQEKEKTNKKDKHDNKGQVAQPETSDEEINSGKTKDKTQHKVKKQCESSKNKKDDRKAKKKESDERLNRTPSPKHEYSHRLLRKSSAPAVQAAAHAYRDQAAHARMQKPSPHLPIVNTRLRPPALPPRSTSSASLYGSVRRYPHHAASYGSPAHPSYPHPQHPYPNAASSVRPNMSYPSYSPAPFPQFPSHHIPPPVATSSRPSGFLDKLFR